MKNNLVIARKKPLSALAFLILAGLVVSATSLFQSVAQAQTPNLALNKPVTCSSVENTGTACANAVDGNTGTRWGSAFSDPQWIRVDLGATNAIGRIVLRWEAAYGKSYQLQTSNDGTTWTILYSTTTGDGGVDDVTVSGSGRYVRMNGTVRATQYGYSLWEFEVYGPGTPTNTPTRTPTNTPTRTPTLVSTECDTPSCITPPGCGTTVVVTSTPTKTPSPTPSATPNATATSTPTATNTPSCGPIYITATPTPMAAGDLGYGSVHGVVTNMFSGAPIAGALITCSHASFTSPSLCSGTRTTAADGSYSFTNVFFHDTDTITVNAQAPGFVSQTIQQSFFTTPNMTANFQMMMGTPTSTPSPTVTSCPLPTAEPLWVEPVTSPTTQLSQVITVYIGRGEAVTVTTESGVFAVTGTFNAYTSPALVNVSLLPNTTHNLSVQARVSPTFCHSGYTLSTTRDRNGVPLVIVQQPATPTPTPTSPSGLPDLVVTSVKGGREMSGSCATNLNLGINVTVQNTGTANAGSFLVEVNNNTGARKTVSGLAASQSTTVWFNLSPQPITNTATVDVTNLVLESNESNNTLTVVGSPGTVTPTGTPPVTCTPTPTLTNTPTPTRTNTPVPSGNLALNKPVVCSSVENGGTACANAVDGNTGTRWSSAFSDPQWIRVDLGTTQSISRIVLRWEAAYGKSYQLQTSNDATNWTTIYSTTTGNGGIDDLTGLSGSGRYVRMNGTVRATQYGYSLWEFEVYN